MNKVYIGYFQDNFLTAKTIYSVAKADSEIEEELMKLYSSNKQEEYKRLVLEVFGKKEQMFLDKQQAQDYAVDMSIGSYPFDLYDYVPEVHFLGHFTLYDKPIACPVEII